MPRFGIVGGGLLGMTLALRLASAGHDVTIFESADRCGGLAAPWKIGPFIWDRHYHVTLFSDTALRALVDELGIGAEMTWMTAQTGFYVGGRMYPLSNLWDFVRFPPLSLLQKLRLAATILSASRIKDRRDLERVTAVDWLTAHSGAQSVRKLWLPLLRAKLGGYAEHASASFILATIDRMYAARRTGAKRELFGYLRGGYYRLLARFEQILAQSGVHTRTSCRVDAVEKRPDGLAVLHAGSEERFDYVVVTLPAPLAAAICTELDARERALCSGAAYQGVVCASLLTERPLSPYYITNITDARVPFTAVIEMTALVNRNAFGGLSLVYLPKYVPPGDPAFSSSDEELASTFLEALSRMHPQFSASDVRAFRVSRAPYVMPLPALNSSGRLPPLRTSVPGLYLAGSAQIVDGTLNVNQTVSFANRVAETLIHETAQRPLLEMNPVL